MPQCCTTYHLLANQPHFSEKSVHIVLINAAPDSTDFALLLFLLFCVCTECKSNSAEQNAMRVIRYPLSLSLFAINFFVSPISVHPSTFVDRSHFLCFLFPPRIWACAAWLARPLHRLAAYINHEMQFYVFPVHVYSFALFRLRTLQHSVLSDEIGGYHAVATFCKQ